MKSSCIHFMHMQQACPRASRPRQTHRASWTRNCEMYILRRWPPSPAPYHSACCMPLLILKQSRCRPSVPLPPVSAPSVTIWHCQARCGGERHGRWRHCFSMPSLPRSRPRARCGRRGRCRRGIRSGADGRASVLPTRLHSACHLFPHSLNCDSLLAVALTRGQT